MDEVSEIKQRLDIVEVISSYLTLKKAGVNLKANCPFHNEKTPSFMVSPERQTFKCFGCGEGGDIFSFIEKIEGLDFYNVLKILADRAGVQLSQKSINYRNTEHKADRKTRLFEINYWAKRVYHKLFLDHAKAEKARRYIDGRGLSQATILAFELGYAPDTWDFIIRFLKSRGYSEEEMFQAGLVVCNDRGGYYDRFRGRIMFPISNIMGAVIGFTSRTLKDDVKEAKYINSADSPIYTKGEVLYGLDKAKMAIREQDMAVVVEGNMDVIACHQAGFKNVVASSGTALTEKQLKILTRYAAEVAFCFDSDTAGQAAMKRAVTLALQNDISAKIVAVSAPFKDPDEAIKSDPKNWFRALEQAKPALQSWIDLLIRQDPDLSVLAKKRIAKEILPVIKMTYSEIEKESYLRYLSKKLSVSEKSLIAALEKTKSAPGPAAAAELAPKKILKPEERIAAILWLEPALAAKALKLTKDLAFIPANLPDFGRMVAAGEIEKVKAKPEEASFLDQAAMVVAAEFDNLEQESLGNELEFLLRRRQSDRREDVKEDFARKIRQAEESGNKAEVRKLIQEFSGLIK